jgi:hypothetical protein
VTPDHDLGRWFLPALGFVGGAIPLLSAYFFPHWQMWWGRTRKVPMSVRSKKAIGSYFLYFGLLTSLNLGAAIGIFMTAGLVLFMIAMRSVYLRDRRDYENSIQPK